MITGDEIRMLFSGVALVLALVSIWLSRCTWLQSNRPIVSAAVRTHNGGNAGIAYDLAVINTGTRPAVCVRLAVDQATLRESMKPEARGPLVDDVIRCFEDDAVIPLIVNGGESVNSFGNTSDDSGGVWKYGSSFPCRLEYRDLEGRAYRSQVTLAIRDSDGFAGGSWKPSNKAMQTDAASPRR